MARARNIKPGFFKNYDLADPGPICQLLFAGLWCLADREGRLEDKPRLIKAEIFPYYEVDVNGELTKLERLGFVDRYSTNGQAYIAVRNFKKHQSPHSTEKRSDLPAPPSDEPAKSATAHVSLDNGESTVDTPKHNGGNPPDSLIPDSLIHTSSQLPASDKFEIHDDWQPSEHFPTDMLRAGIPESFLTITALAEFIGYWKTRDSPARHTQAQWDHKFLQILINAKSKPGVSHANSSRGTRKLTSHDRVMLANSAAAAGR